MNIRDTIKRLSLPIIPHGSLMIDATPRDYVRSQWATRPWKQGSPIVNGVESRDAEQCSGCEYYLYLRRKHVDASILEAEWSIYMSWAHAWLRTSSTQSDFCPQCAPNINTLLSRDHTNVSDTKHAFQTIATLSVRSAQDAYLTVRKYPTGSVMLMSSVNIPDMSKVLLAHGLIPVPVDIDLDTCAVKPELQREMLTYQHRNGYLVIGYINAYIYGRRNNIEELIQICHQHKVPFLEDAAQQFQDSRYRGHTDSDLVMFSFGTIKALTCFGGGICRVKDPQIFLRMRDHLSSLPQFSSDALRLKIIKTGIVGAMTNNTRIATMTVTMSRILGIDYRQFIVEKIRGFSTAEMLFKIRQQLNPVQIQLMSERLVPVTEDHFTKSRAAGTLTVQLQKQFRNIYIPGQKAEQCSFWLFPVVVHDVDTVYTALDQYGVDVYKGATQQSHVEWPFTFLPPTVLQPINAKWMIEHVLYLPIHARVDEVANKHICQAVVECVKGHKIPCLPNISSKL